MTAEIKSVWQRVNKVLTIINLILLGVLTANVVRYKEIRDKKIPVIANVFLMLFLGLGIYAAVYSFV